MHSCAAQTKSNFVRTVTDFPHSRLGLLIMEPRLASSLRWWWARKTFDVMLSCIWCCDMLDNDTLFSEKLALETSWKVVWTCQMIEWSSRIETQLVSKLQLGRNDKNSNIFLSGRKLLEWQIKNSSNQSPRQTTIPRYDYANLEHNFEGISYNVTAEIAKSSTLLEHPSALTYCLSATRPEGMEQLTHFSFLMKVSHGGEDWKRLINPQKLSTIKARTSSLLSHWKCLVLWASTTF